MAVRLISSLSLLINAQKRGGEEREERERDKLPKFSKEIKKKLGRKVGRRGGKKVLLNVWTGGGGDFSPVKL